MTELKEWLNSINTGKNNLIDEDSDLEKKYPSYIVNRCLSGHIDAVMFANEMNKHPNLAKKLQYDFFLNSLRKRKRYSPWLRNCLLYTSPSPRDTMSSRMPSSA